MSRLAAMSAGSTGSGAGDVDGGAARRRLEGSLAIGMQVTTVIRALHEVESAVKGERDLAALADAQEALDMICRQIRRTRARLGLGAPD